jgi:hypothetical protein
VDGVVGKWLLMMNGVEDLVESGSDVVPRTVVLVFLLHPQELSFLVLFEDVVDVHIGKGSQLLDSDDCD